LKNRPLWNPPQNFSYTVSLGYYVSCILPYKQKFLQGSRGRFLQKKPPGRRRQKLTLTSVILVMFLVGSVFGEVAAVIHEVGYPRFLDVDDSQLYIVENASIYIYSLKDFKLKKKIGGAGPGPQKFQAMPPLTVDARSDNIIVNSAGKVSFFSKDGKLKKELKVKIVGSAFQPLKNAYAAQGVAFAGRNAFAAVNLFDTQLNKIKEVFRYDTPAVQDGKIDLFHQDALFTTYEDKLFIASMKGLTIDVLDHTGKHLYTIRYPKKHKKRKFTPRDEKEFREYLRLVASHDYEVAKDRLIFPDYYPEIAAFVISDNNVFVVTWKRKPGQSEVVIFDMKGKLIKQAYYPFVLQDPVSGYPWNINNRKLYQLIENKDTRKWELHVNLLAIDY
jgi:hypothetical protein